MPAFLRHAQNNCFVLKQLGRARKDFLSSRVTRVFVLRSPFESSPFDIIFTPSARPPANCPVHCATPSPTIAEDSKECGVQRTFASSVHLSPAFRERAIISPWQLFRGGGGGVNVKCAHYYLPTLGHWVELIWHECSKHSMANVFMREDRNQWDALEPPSSSKEVIMPPLMVMSHELPIRACAQNQTDNVVPYLLLAAPPTVARDYYICFLPPPLSSATCCSQPESSLILYDWLVAPRSAIPSLSLSPYCLFAGKRTRIARQSFW